MLSRLYHANQGILRQKLGLLQLLEHQRGGSSSSGASTAFQQVCPLVGASVGQHMRHSMDHIERAITATSHPESTQIHYDVRQRGGLDEYDMAAARTRIERVSKLLQEQLMDSDHYVPVMDHRVQACFMLSGDDDKEYALPSTAARELGFAVHHAIHHMAMIKVIVVHTLQVPESKLPTGFGRAPSTQNFDRQQHQQHQPSEQ